MRKRLIITASLIRGFLISKSFRRWILRILIILLIAHILFILSYRWIDPRSSAFIRRDQMALKQSAPGSRVQHEWFNISDIAPEMQLAVIASEDQKFPGHFGFDLSAIEEAVKHNTGNSGTRGASTITQQVAKNLFLWPSKSFFRKGLEAYLTLWIELLWPKQRILEIYLNIAQFDSHIFGVGAAARFFFNCVPSDLTFYKSALLAAVLPNPVRYSVEKPSIYLYERVDWIQSQMRQLEYDYLNHM